VTFLKNIKLNNDSWNYNWKDIYLFDETTKDANKWRKGSVDWNLDELYTKYGLLFAIDMPYLNKEKFHNYTIFIDRIDIKVEILPIWDRI
jgi:hypothetical protein